MDSNIKIGIRCTGDHRVIVLHVGRFQRLCRRGGSLGKSEVPGSKSEFAGGRRVAHGRIHAAAGRVCRESDSVRPKAERACAMKAEGDAIERLNLPPLTAYY